MNTARKEQTTMNAKTLARPADAGTMTTFSGSQRDPLAITRMLEDAQSHCILVSPATSAGRLPEGFEVTFSTVLVDTQLDAKGYSVSGDIYSVGGPKFGLSRAVLDKLGAASGVSWDPHLSRRLDNGRDPKYVLFLAVGTYRLFDNRECVLQGTKEMDLRDGSPQVEAIKARARDGGDREKQLREMRLHILAHAETKARLRAIRAMGIKSAYTLDELKKPFVVARLMFTGRTEDRELAREFARMNAMAAIGGARALYGASVPTPAFTMMAPVEPPPVGQSLDPEPEREALPPAPRPAAEPPPSEPRAREQAPAPSNDEHVMKFGRAKGTPISQANDHDLDWYAKAIAKGIDDPAKAQYRAKGERDLAEIRAEQARRKAPATNTSAAVDDPYAERDDFDNGDDEIPY